MSYRSDPAAEYFEKILRYPSTPKQERHIKTNNLLPKTLFLLP
jgi:hypothetical protein